MDWSLVDTVRTTRAVNIRIARPRNALWRAILRRVILSTHSSGLPACVAKNKNSTRSENGSLGRDERRSTCDTGRSCRSRIVQELFIQNSFLTNSSFHPEYLFENFFSSPRISLFTMKKTRYADSLNGTWRKFSGLLHSMATSSSGRQVHIPILLQYFSKYFPQYFSMALISGGLEETARRGWDSGVPRSEGEAFSLSKQMEEVVHCEIAVGFEWCNAKHLFLKVTLLLP